MNVNWSILDPALQSNPGNAFHAGFERSATQGALARLAGNPQDAQAMGVLAQLNPQAAFAMQDRATEQARLAETRRIGTQAAGGDMRGAQSAALAAGNTDLAQTLGQLNEQEAKSARERFQALGGFAAHIRSLPYEQRAPVLQANAGRLRELGFGDDVISGFDPTDANVDAVLTQGMTAEQYLEQRYGGQFTIGGTRFDRAGRPIVSLPEHKPVEGIGLVEVPVQTPVYPGGSSPPAASSRPPLPEGATPESLRAEAAEAIKQGVDPAIVARELQTDLQQLQGGAAPPGPQTFPNPGEFNDPAALDAWNGSGRGIW